MYQCSLCALVRGTPDLSHAALLEAKLTMAARDACSCSQPDAEQAEARRAMYGRSIFCFFYS